jgi:hypothetical protein
MITTNLPPETQSVVVGCLLGDGYLTPNGSLQVEQCLDQAAYTLWKYQMLQPIAGRLPTLVERYDGRTEKTYRSMRFYTKAVLKDFRASFYQDRKKVVPNNLGDILDSLAVAVWFMDDGGRGARTPRGLVFNTSGFSAEEQVFLKRILVDRFGVHTSIHPRRKGFQLYVKAESFSRFSELVSPYLVTSMRYKLPVDPVTTSPRRQRRDSGPVPSGTDPRPL